MMRFLREWPRHVRLGLLAASASVLAAPGARAETPPDRVAAYGHVSPGERVRTIALPTYLGAPAVVAELLVKEGDQVTRDQKLAVTQHRAVAAADVALAKARLKTSRERLTSVKTTAKVRAAEIAVAQAEVAEAEAALARAEVLLLGTEIAAPIEGQILKILSFPGEGAAGQALLELGETHAMQIKAELNVADAVRVKPGAKATLKSEAWRGEIAGTVTRVRPRVERSALSAPSTFSNVDRIVVEATITPETPERLSGLSGAEVTVLIAAEPAAK